jgi:hypothetical protein
MKWPSRRNSELAISAISSFVAGALGIISLLSPLWLLAVVSARRVFCPDVHGVTLIISLSGAPF